MKALALLSAALLIVGCGSQPASAPAPKAETPANAQVSYAEDIQPIFNQSCMPCHAGGKDAKGSYNLTGYANAMGSGKDPVANVLPGNPDSSTLYRRVIDTVPPQMPKARPALTAVQLAAIQKWIDQGAPDNQTRPREPQPLPMEPQMNAEGHRLSSRPGTCPFGGREV